MKLCHKELGGVYCFLEDGHEGSCMDAAGRTIFEEGHAGAGVGSSCRKYEDEITTLKVKLAEAEKRRDYYFNLIDDVARQRDEWTRLYHEHLSERAAAIGLLERQLIIIKQWCGRAVYLLNEKRRKDGESEIELPAGEISLEPLDGPPLGTAAAFWEKHKRLFEELRAVQIDIAAAKRRAMEAP